MDDDALAARWTSFADVRANIFRVDQSFEPLDDVAELAARAGLVNRNWNEMGPVLGTTQEPYVFTVYRPSRAVQCIDSSRWQVDDGVSTLEVSDDNAIAVAVREVERLGLSDRDVFRPTRVTRLNVASGQKDGIPVAARVIDVGVVLTRIIDEVPVEGQGGNIVVYLDWDLELTGFQRVARRISGVYEPVRGWRQIDEVVAEVETYWRAERNRGLTIEDARLCYLELGRLQEQQFIQPVYALSLRLTNRENDEVRTAEHYAAAAVNGIGALMPSDFGPPTQDR
ncbi:hypothetical protein [Mycolicibacterium sp.]|uniref:hypothetical protein n=1 Tax=Mycolicibacterium sp. TaxID=2320850 RepID=UPI0037C61D45